MDFDQKVSYMQHIFSGSVLKKYYMVLEECRDSEKGLAGYQWALIPMKDINIEQLWTWDKTDSNDSSGICTWYATYA